MVPIQVGMGMLRRGVMSDLLVRICGDFMHDDEMEFGVGKRLGT